MKYRDMLLDIGTEEIGHVEMLATMIARLLEGDPASQKIAAETPVIGAVLGGNKVDLNAINPQHLIVSGQGAMPANSVGVPWSGAYIVASGNLLADMQSNLHAESQGRLQAARVYELAHDNGVKEMLSFMIARDTMHQNQWMAAIEEIQKDGIDSFPLPASFPRERQDGSVAYQFMNFSEGTESKGGRWAGGPSMDGEGTFEYVEIPKAMGAEPELGPADPKLHGMDPSKNTGTAGSEPSR